ncbi:MAG: hypothetical protein KDD60_02730 [Bdellovibrionales bacterium]|nr:hypothetical protein [Bdellovibrionales bacterium]
MNSAYKKILSLFILIVASSLLFHYFYFHSEDIVSSQYNSWLSTLEEDYERGEHTEVTLSISSSAEAFKKQWSFSSTPGENSSAVLSILRLIREAHLIRSQHSQAEESLTIAIHAGKYSVESTIPWEQVQANVKAKNLLVLLENRTDGADPTHTS